MSLNVNYTHNEINNTKQSDGEVPVILVLWGMRATPSFPPLQVHSGPEW